MSNSELFLNFAHTDAVAIKPHGNYNPGNRIVVGYNRNGNLIWFWERRSFWRRAKAFIAKGLSGIARAVKWLLPIAGVAAKAIGWYF